MIPRMSKTMHDYARMGAGVRLAEIQSEIAAIRDAFPELEGQPRKHRGGRPKAPATAPPAEPQPPAVPAKRKMSAAARKAISKAQKKRWAAQRAMAAAT